MKFLFVLTLLSLTLNAFAEVRQVGCNKQQREIIKRGLQKDKIEAVHLLNDIDRAFHRKDISWNDWRKLLVARTIVQCAQRKMNTLDFVCGSGVPMAAITYPVISKKVYLGGPAFTGDDTGLYLHEATHHCGTNDATYFDSSSHPRNIGVRGWQSIASTYDYWMRFGFCLPGECQ